ncbi:MAG: nuclear transport factor 2 family protein [Gammaproteobacteria bacterium]|nr:nuclear transport factor 2 family protein [Gammaproteobacteria bacterium]
MNNVTDNLMQLFNRFPEVTANEMASIYADHAVFEDPVTRIEGLDNIYRYFKKIYHGVISCQFQYTKVIKSNNQAAISWVMTLQHRKLKHGDPVVIEGCSLITYTDKILSHRDYFDLGAMLYENIPLLGSVTRYIKNRMHQ